MLASCCARSATTAVRWALDLQAGNSSIWLLRRGSPSPHGTRYAELFMFSFACSAAYLLCSAHLRWHVEQGPHANCASTIRLPERWRVCALAELRDSTAQLTGGGCAQHSRLAPVARVRQHERVCLQIGKKCVLFLNVLPCALNDPTAACIRTCRVPMSNEVAAHLPQPSSKRATIALATPSQARPSLPPRIVNCCAPQPLTAQDELIATDNAKVGTSWAKMLRRGCVQ